MTQVKLQIGYYVTIRPHIFRVGFQAKSVIKQGGASATYLALYRQAGHGAKAQRQ